MVRGSWYALRVKHTCERTSLTILSTGLGAGMPITRAQGRTEVAGRNERIGSSSFPGIRNLPVFLGESRPLLTAPQLMHVVNSGGSLGQ
jgi:hypothetical protein